MVNSDSSWLLISPDSFFADQFVADLQKNSSTQVKNFYGDQSSLDTFLAEVTQTDLFSTSKIFYLKEAHKLKKKQWQAIVEIFKKNLHVGSVCIHVEKLAAKHSAYLFFQQKNSLKIFKKIYPNQIPRWLISHAGRYRYKIDQNAAELLVEHVGNHSLALLVQAFKNLALAFYPQKNISLEMVEQFYGFIQVADIFEWVDKLVSLNFIASTEVLDQMLASGQSPHLLLSVLIRHFRLLRAAYQTKVQGLNKFDSAKKMGLPPFIAERYLKQIQFISAHFLQSFLKKLEEIDTNLKSQPLNPKLVFYQLMHQLFASKKSYS